MEKLIINGGNKLEGEIEIEGSKNAVLPILAATVLNSGINVIKNCPKLKDVHIMLKILEELGCKVQEQGSTVIVDSSTLHGQKIPDNLASEMRSSIVFLGPVLARCGKVTISYPGGCDTLWTLFYCLRKYTFLDNGDCKKVKKATFFRLIICLYYFIIDVKPIILTC